MNTSPAQQRQDRDSQPVAGRGRGSVVGGFRSFATGASSGRGSASASGRPVTPPGGVRPVVASRGPIRPVDRAIAALTWQLQLQQVWDE